MSLTVPVAKEIYTYDRAATVVKKEIAALDRMLRDQGGRLEYIFSNNKEMASYYVRELLGEDYATGLTRDVMSVATSSANREELVSRIRSMIGDRRSKVSAIEAKETDGAITTFAGPSKLAPGYASWLMQACGSANLLHLRETRERIGRDEAQELLSLKVTRGGPERLTVIQRTVRSLLGVEIDAFQSEAARRSGETSAEMDIDQFLVDANGAGIREALRLILDVELKKPQLLLIEEPEVHLHPGLEHAVYSYLRSRSSDIQMFVTTHSTNFVDSVSFQNIYLVSKHPVEGTTCSTLGSGDAPLRIPAELGLRLSTVFMFDRLVFVEGPSDEAVLREFCAKLDLDLAKANVGFVQMGGVRNFAHFAAHATLDVLARRRIRMWFITDRDERDDEEVRRMVDRLGGNATLKVLARRELENYLLDNSAIGDLIGEKTNRERPVASADIQKAIDDAARNLKDEVVRLRVHKKMLAPIYLQVRNVEGTVEERLENAIKAIEARKADLLAITSAIEEECAADWDTHARTNSPGSVILEQVFKSFGCDFKKENGDSARLARLMPPDAIAAEIRDLLESLSR